VRFLGSGFLYQSININSISYSNLGLKNNPTFFCCNSALLQNKGNSTLIQCVRRQEEHHSALTHCPAIVILSMVSMVRQNSPPTESTQNAIPVNAELTLFYTLYG
jgi:hypothetical protein